MDVTRIAQFYVYVIEPSLKVLAFFVVVITVLYIFNSLGDSKKKADLVNNTFNFIMRSMVFVFTGLGRLALILTRVLLKLVSTIITAISDFFTSKI